jgi:hypothetical protein
VAVLSSGTGRCTNPTGSPGDISEPLNVVWLGPVYGELIAT